MKFETDQRGFAAKTCMYLSPMICRFYADVELYLEVLIVKKHSLDIFHKGLHL